MRKTSKPQITVQTFAEHQVITQPNPLRAAVRHVADGEEDPVARAEKALAELSGEFNDWMKDECDRLAATHQRLVDEGANEATRGDFFRAAHDVKGHAATFGYPRAAVAADSLCRLIEHAPDLGSVPDNLVAHHVSSIQAIVREHARLERMGIADELGRSLRNMTDKFLIAANHDRPEHLEAVLAPSIVPQG